MPTKKKVEPKPNMVDAIITRDGGTAQAPEASMIAAAGTIAAAVKKLKAKKK